MEVSIGPEIIRSYKRLSYTAWHALAEFIDNSVQSYVDNKEELQHLDSSTGQGLTVSISYTQAGGGAITIADNAMGMSYQELTNALRIGRPPVNTSGLSEFGMGLKTAACWFGDQWEVKTKKLGLERGEKIVFDVEQIASGNPDLHHSSFHAPTNDHYTIIAIEDLNRSFFGGNLRTIKRFLSSMYRVQIKEGALALSFNNEWLSWIPPTEGGNVHVEDGEECVRSFAFRINEKKVSGWIAILERGSRSNAGLTIIRRGRVIKGWPDSWRPQTIYGQFEGSNDLVNQRLVGEVILDAFGVSHTKDDILWDADEQDQVESELAIVADDFIKIARSYRKRGVSGSFPSKAVVNAALSMLEEEIQSPRFSGVLAFNGQVPIEGYEAIARTLLNGLHAFDPQVVYEVHGLTLNVFLSEISTDKDPYLGIEMSAEDELNVVINMKHPHVRDLSGRKGVLNHLKTCTYEGVAQWKVQKTWDADRPDLIRVVKDSLLRVGSSIDDPS